MREEKTPLQPLIRKLLTVTVGEFVESCIKGAGLAYGAIVVAKKFGVLPVRKR